MTNGEEGLVQRTPSWLITATIKSRWRFQSWPCMSQCFVQAQADAHLASEQVNREHGKWVLPLETASLYLHPLRTSHHGRRFVSLPILGRTRNSHVFSGRDPVEVRPAPISTSTTRNSCCRLRSGSMDCYGTSVRVGRGQASRASRQWLDQRVPKPACQGAW